MPRCPECQSEYSQELEACPSCGTTPESIRCARCGETFEASDACPVCGLASSAFPCDLHPDMEAEGRCVLCGAAVCKKCRHGDQHTYLCVEHADAVVIQGWAQVYTTTSEVEAGLLRENLIAEGIDAQIYSQKDNMLSVDLGELSIVRLLVPAWEYNQAQQVIRDHMDRDGEVSFACPECGEAYEPGAEACAACGAVISTGPD